MTPEPDSPSTILLVEDEAPIRRLAAAILERAGYRVVAAEDEASAMSAAGAMDEPPDLVVTDLLLPGGNGSGLASRLRERWAGLPVIVVSGRPAGADELPAGAAYLAKPYGPSELLDAVRDGLANGDAAPG